MIPSKILSLVALAATARATSIAFNTSAVSDIDVATLISFPGIRNLGTGLCLQALGDGAGSIVQRECDSSNIQQLWSSHAVSSGSTVYQIQSAFGQCMWTASDANRKVIAASVVVAGSCVLSTGNGMPSNTQYLAHGSVPGVTSWESRVAFTNTGFCLDGSSFQNVAMFPCTGSVTQLWAVAG